MFAAIKLSALTPNDMNMLIAWCGFKHVLILKVHAQRPSFQYSAAQTRSRPSRLAV